MKTYPISSSPVEEIDFKVGDENYALVRRIRHAGSQGLLSSQAIILNKRELLTLYQAIQEEITK